MKIRIIYLGIDAKENYAAFCKAHKDGYNYSHTDGRAGLMYFIKRI